MPLEWNCQICHVVLGKSIRRIINVAFEWFTASDRLASPPKLADAIEILLQLPAPFIGALVNICKSIESISFQTQTCDERHPLIRRSCIRSSKIGLKSNCGRIRSEIDAIVGPKSSNFQPHLNFSKEFVGRSVVGLPESRTHFSKKKKSNICGGSAVVSPSGRGANRVVAPRRPLLIHRALKHQQQQP